MKTVAVIGDVIVDWYWHAMHTRTSPENDKRVLSIFDTNYRMGGAAAVAMLLRGMGCRVSLYGVVGLDEPGQWLMNELWDDGVNTSGIERPRGSKTTVKHRVVVDGVIDTDRCDFDRFRSYDVEHLKDINANVVVVCDYGKGVVAQDTIAKIRKRYDGEIIVDPCINTPWRHYDGANIIKCNDAEMETECRRVSVSTLRQMAAIRCCHIVATRGEHGCIFGGWQEDHESLPAVAPRCIDATGAGDTVVAAIAASHGLSLRERCQYAMRAAAEQIQSIGIRRVRCELHSTSTAPSA